MAENPFYRFYRFVRVPMSPRDWRKMPRVAGHKNEYIGGEAWYTPRPDTFVCHLPLDEWAGPPAGGEAWGELEPVVEPAVVRRMVEADWKELPDAFASAFGNQAPLSQWRGGAAHTAARAVLDWTRRGRDGPVLHDCCHVALVGGRGGGKEADFDHLAGAAILTLVDVRRLRGLPVDGAVPHPDAANHPDARLLPHLDWLFVDGWHKRRGLATLLLDAAVKSLRAAGHRTLASTCLVDNGPSACWHWRNGFRLPPDPMRGWQRYELSGGR